MEELHATQDIQEFIWILNSFRSIINDADLSSLIWLEFTILNVFSIFFCPSYH